jgi:prephenate dehydrogenase
MTATFRRIAVLGLGLIGGSITQALRQAAKDVVGFDVDSATAAAASSAGVSVVRTPSAAVVDADLVVLAMALPELSDALRAIAADVAPGTVVTDVGTLKQPVLHQVRAELPQVRFVGGHPLAGTEDSGWDAADPLLFRDAPWTLTLEPDTDIGAWVRVAELVCDLGARPVPSTAADQDAAVARVIGLPHVLAEALALIGLDGGPLGLSLAAGSYKSGSRVARTRPELVATWCDHNPALVTALDDAITRLTEARDALAGSGSVINLARAGHQARIGWEGRHFVPVELSAQPAELLAHGAAGGWITAVLREDGAASQSGVRLLGMRPVS